jgi:hypothetical protein
LSIGDTATFCPVCGAPADPPEAAPVPASAAGLEAEARACEKSDPARAAALYRQAIVAHLESGDDPLSDRSMRRDVQRLFDRLSLVLKREGLVTEALEEIEAAAYLGLVDGEDGGLKAQRESLKKRRDALRRAVTKAART